jgi:transcriptional regulator of aromatic amino acid metabolism
LFLRGKEIENDDERESEGDWPGLQAMEALWEDLSREPDRVESPSWHQDLLKETESRVESGEATFPNRVLDQVVVDFDGSVLEIDFQGVPSTKRIADRLVQAALGQDPPVSLPPL